MRSVAEGKRWMVVLVLAWLAGCATLLGTRTVEVSQMQLQQWVERQFPLDNRLLELLDVRLATPRLALRPETNRIATEFEVTVSDRVFKSPHRGALAIDYALRFETSDNTVRATNVRIERVEIDGAPALLQRQLDRIALRLAEQALDERPIYTLRPKDLEAVQGRRYRPGDIRVTPAGLVITLLPIEAR